MLVFRFAGEELVECQNDGILRGLGILYGGGIGLNPHDEFLVRLLVAKDRESIIVAFAHLLAIESGDFGNAFKNAGFRHDESAFAVLVVDLADEIAGDFKVLFLVITDGYDVGIVEQNVRRHERGISEKRVIGRDALGYFVFIRVATFEKSHGTDRRENPSQFVDLRDRALLEKDAFRRIETAGEKIDRHAADVFAELGGIVGRRHRVVVRDEIITVAFALGIDGWFDRAKVISHVKTSAWLQAGQNSHTRDLRLFREKRKSKRARSNQSVTLFGWC